MKENLRLPVAAPINLTSELSARFQRTVQYHFQRLTQNAQTEWERRFAGEDPSDACVSVRIAGPRQLRPVA